jgi:hypothetical protein
MNLAEHRQSRPRRRSRSIGIEDLHIFSAALPATMLRFCNIVPLFHQVRLPRSVFQRAIKAMLFCAWGAGRDESLANE